MLAGKVIAESDILKLIKKKEISVKVKVLDFCLIATFHWIKGVYF